ncbi:related to UBA domain-containing protein RUP1 [Nakaseomyces glabratus]|nr:Ubiquitin-associated domain (UBA) profile [Nakaseomyces glabratus]QNG14723.1 uncharacterized protein GWK60_I02695 [Nakaseomyces glabratus]SCV14499.1 related to UBA domain-containing protein RUP1 [Nakaseomyces glabratus]SLM13212.1 related to UBA domain-containing protein RUP1 [Nakaseomyces glabratus]
MDFEGNVQSLLEMGIARDVAEQALRECNGDVEAALNCIFNTPNEIDNDAMAGQQMGSVPVGTQGIFDDSAFKIQENNPPQSQSYSEQQLVQENLPDNTFRSDSDTNSDSDSSSSLEQSQYTSIDDLIPQQFKNTMDYPTVVIPAPAVPNHIYYCALFALFISIHLPHYFVKADHDDMPLLFSPDWFNDIDREPEDEPLLVLRDQLHKLIAVQNSNDHSARAFVTSKMFDVDLQSVIQSNEPMLTNPNYFHLYQILPSFIKTIANLSYTEKNLFISSAIQGGEEASSSKESLLSLFHFLPEEYESNLYKMFNVLLYPDDDHDIGEDEDEVSENSLKELAPVMTIIFNEAENIDENAPVTNGVEVPLKFYPQLYTKKCKDQLISHVLSKRKDGRKELKQILKDIGNLKSYQGKDILSFINSSLDYLTKDKDDSGIAEELHKLKDELTAKKTEKMNSYKQISEKMHTEWNIQNPELKIVETATKLGLIDEPYFLNLAVVSPFFYFVRNRKDEWYEVRFNPFNTAEDKISVGKCDGPGEVIQHVKNSTTVPNSTPLMFVYSKDSYMADDTEMQELLSQNKTLLDFFKQDQIYLQNFENARGEGDIRI